MSHPVGYAWPWNPKYASLHQEAWIRAATGRREEHLSRPHTPIPPPAHPTYDLVKEIKAALMEDSGDRGDVTTQATVAAGTRAEATFLAKSPGVVAGLAVADLVFQLVDPNLTVEWHCKDGDHLPAGQRFGFVRGDAASILVAERIALNYMQRMSGIATATAALVTAVQGTHARILETRKTVPGWRQLDKWAVLIGGGTNHRMGLWDQMLIKDNHITAAGGITHAVARGESFIKEKSLDDLTIVVEASTLDEVRDVLGMLKDGKAPHLTRLMLDNMARRDSSCPGGVDVSLLAQAVQLVDGAIATEASGNVTLETVRTIADTGVTHISVGYITHSIQAQDISLKIKLLP